ncbi:hypothetical protein SFUMM280S_06648 [Streptomyces fumanus]
MRWVRTSVSVSERNSTPSASSLRRSSAALSMMPLCTTATLWSADRCGWALTSEGAPWVAQRVWAMPVVPLKRAGTRASRSRTRPLALTIFRPADFGELTTMPAESYPRYSRRWRPSRSSGATSRLPMYPTIPHMDA